MISTTTSRFDFDVAGRDLTRMTPEEQRARQWIAAHNERLVMTEGQYYYVPKKALEDLLAAALPFAAITPSSLFEPHEDPGYVMYLAEHGVMPDITREELEELRKMLG